MVKHAYLQFTHKGKTIFNAGDDNAVKQKNATDTFWMRRHQPQYEPLFPFQAGHKLCTEENTGSRGLMFFYQTHHSLTTLWKLSGTLAFGEHGCGHECIHNFQERSFHLSSCCHLLSREGYSVILAAKLHIQLCGLTAIQACASIPHSIACLGFPRACSSFSTSSIIMVNEVLA